MTRLVFPRYPSYDPTDPERLLALGYTAARYQLPPRTRPARPFRATPPLPLFVDGGVTNRQHGVSPLLAALCSRYPSTLHAILIGQTVPVTRQSASTPVWMLTPFPSPPRTHALALPYLLTLPHLPISAPQRFRGYALSPQAYAHTPRDWHTMLRTFPAATLFLTGLTPLANLKMLDRLRAEGLV